MLLVLPDYRQTKHNDGTLKVNFETPKTLPSKDFGASTLNFLISPVTKHNGMLKQRDKIKQSVWSQFFLAQIPHTGVYLVGAMN